MTEKIVYNGDVELCTQAFGDSADPPCLLIMGAGASMVRWDERLIEQFVARGRYAIRFDNRDTGRSTTYPHSEPAYTLADMARDAIAVLDAYGIEKAHVMGRSMGGMITQHVMLDFPERVSTATLIYSTPSPGVAGGDTKDRLPGVTDELTTAMRAAPPAAASDAEQRAHQLHVQRILNGTRYPLDEARTVELFDIERNRARDLAASGNHVHAIRKSPPWRDRLAAIDIRTLIVHGTDDPILPFPYGEALHAAISGAEMMVLDGVGHALPPEIWSDLIERLVAHTAS